MNTKQTVTMQTKQNIMKTRQILPQLQRARLKSPMLMLLALFAMLLGAMTVSAGASTPTTTTVTTSGSPTNYGAAVTFTATVTPNTIPDGSAVWFLDNNTLIGSAVTVNGTARYTAVGGALNTGSHTIQAIYIGDSNYQLSASPTITQVVTRKALALIAASTIAVKTYDGLLAAGAVSPVQLDPGSFYGSQTVTATGLADPYPSANVGTNNNVRIVYTLSDGLNGGYATNYSLADGAATGVVTNKALSVTATIAPRAYDSTHTAGLVTPGLPVGLVGSETLEVTGSAAAYPGTNAMLYYENRITYTLANGTGGGLAANYSLADGWADGLITNKALSITGTTVTKVYDGTVSAGVVNTLGDLSGFVGSERVTATGTPGAYPGTNATSYPTVPISYVLANGANGGLAANYSLAPGTAAGVITAKPLSLVTPFSTIAPRAYNGSKAAGLVTVGGISGLIGTETLNQTMGVGADYPSAYIGTYPVAITNTLHDGTGLAANYSLTNGVASGTITQAVLTVTGIVAQNTNYNGGNVATLNLSSAALVGKVGADDVTLTTASAAGAFDTKNIGTNKTVTVSGLALSGTIQTNYTLTQPTTIANIAAKPLTVTGATVTPKVYDGTPNAVITGATLSSGGVVGSEVVTLANATTGTFDTKNVGNNKPVLTAMTLTGDATGNYTNYTLAQPTLTGTITAATLTITAIADSKTYGQTRNYGSGSTAFTALPAPISPDSVTSVTLACDGGTATAAAGGSYDITASNPQGNGLGNYAIVYGVPKNKLIVNQAPLGVLAANASRAYGQTNPVFTVTYFGFVNAETNTVLGGTLTNACTAVANSPIGQYPIEPSGLASANYSITYTNGMLTVGANQLTVTADNKTKFYGQADPTNTVTCTGFINGDTITNLGGTLQFERPPGEASNTYAIHPYGLTSTNYSITFSNGTLTIQKANVLVAADPKSKTYGDLNPTLTATVTGTNNSDTINYTIAATNSSQFSSVGGYPIEVTLLNNNTNYNVTKSDSKLTVNKKAATVAARPASMRYGGTPTLLADVTGTVNSDVLNYTLPTTATTNSSPGNYLISVSMNSNPNYDVTVTYNTLTVNGALLVVQPANTNRAYGQPNPGFKATYSGFVNGETNTVLGGTLHLTSDATPDSPIGLYNIWSTGLTSANYIITFGSGQLEVLPNALTVTADNKAKAYGQGDPHFTVRYSGFVNGDTTNNLGGTLYFNRTTGGGTNDPIGHYPIMPSGLTSTNYAITFATGTLTIAQSAVMVVANATNKFYGAANPELLATVTGLAPGDTLDYTLTTTATNKPFDTVGRYEITVHLAENKNTNYFVTATNNWLTVKPAVTWVTARPQSKSYGDTNPGLSADLGPVVNGDTLAYQIGTDAQQFSPTNRYLITVTPTDGANTNYSVTATNNWLTVNPRAATVVANNKTKAYGADNPFLDATVTGTTNGDRLSYSLDTTAVQLSPKGDYPITVTLYSNPNYSVTTNYGTLKVLPNALTVTANNQSKYYGQLDPTNTVTYVGFINGDTNTSLGGTLEFNRAPGEASNTYAITPSGLTSTNYSITFSNGTLTIQKAIVTVVANPTNKFYGDVNPPLTAKVTGTNNSDTILYTLAATNASQFSTVGSYWITVTVDVNNNTNYIIYPTNSTLTVNKKDASVLANHKHKTYGAANPPLDASVSGIVPGESLAYRLDTTATPTSGVTNYPITVTLGLNPNYNVTATDSELTVDKRDATVAANTGFSTYGNDPVPGLTATVSGNVNGDIIAYQLHTTGVQSSPIGTYPIWVTLTNGLNPNYSVTTSTNTLYVGTRKASVAAKPKTKAYGDIVPPLDATETGVLPGDKLIYSLTTLATTNSPVGNYDITVTLDVNTNYNVLAFNNVLKITQAISETTVGSSKNPSVLGSNVTFTATVRLGANAVILPVGNVQFFTNGLAMGDPVALVGRLASISLANLPVGDTPVDAIFEPTDPINVLSSLETVVQTVHIFAGTPAIESVKVNTNGTVTVTFIGTPYGEYVVQGNVGFDPANWVSFSTNTAGSNGKWTIVDSTVGHVSRYYRAVSP